MIEWKAAKKDEQKEKEKVSSGDGNVPVVKSDSNHIYFYADVDHQPCLDLNKALQEKADELLTIALKNDFGKPKIYLHINSYGGSIFAGISSMDTILRLREKVDIITIVEGGVASAGTFLSVVGAERWMTRNSYMLIHQLSSGLYGKYRDLKDDMKNSDELMKMIKHVYSQYTQVPDAEVDKILDHDLWWDSEKCLEMKLIDKII
jgi:ATP-dependent Clp endopeptidase proteolytic subunit ClpP